jgi:hypothetical protein
MMKASVNANDIDVISVNSCGKSCTTISEGIDWLDRV